jgi:hypothetical protein
MYLLRTQTTVPLDIRTDPDATEASAAVGRLVRCKAEEVLPVVDELLGRVQAARGQTRSAFHIRTAWCHSRSRSLVLWRRTRD